MKNHLWTKTKRSILRFWVTVFFSCQAKFTDEPNKDTLQEVDSEEMNSTKHEAPADFELKRQGLAEISFLQYSWSRFLFSRFNTANNWHRGSVRNPVETWEGSCDNISGPWHDTRSNWTRVLIWKIVNSLRSDIIFIKKVEIFKFRHETLCSSVSKHRQGRRPWWRWPVSDL